MSIKTKVAAFAIAAVALTGGIAASTQDAQAGKFQHHHGLGIGVGLAAGALFAAAASSAYADDYGYRRCGWVRQFDAYGNYMGRVRTCN